MEVISDTQKCKLTQMKRERTTVSLLNAHDEFLNERSKWADVQIGIKGKRPRPSYKTNLEFRNGIGNVVVARKGAELRKQKSNNQEVRDINTNPSRIPKINMYFAQHLLYTHQKHCKNCYSDHYHEESVNENKTCLNHMRSEPALDCSICKQTFPNNHLLVQHVLKIHTVTPINMIVFFCPFCELVFSTKDSLKEHFSNFHPLNFGKTFVNTPDLPDIIVNGTNHSSSLNQTNDVYSILPIISDVAENEIEPIESVIPKIEVDTMCHLCSREFDTEESLEIHFNEHALKIKYRCQVCDADFFEKKELYLHFCTHKDREFNEILDHERDPVTIEKNSNDLPKSSSSFKCILCEKVTFDRKDHHFKRYHEDFDYNVFQCYVCQMFFGSRKEIDAHLGKHIGNEAAYSVEGQVTVNDQGQIKTVKRHKCGQCPRSFKRPYELKNHLEICGKTIKYTCKDCPMSFDSKTTMERHFETKHVPPENKVYSCKTCGSSFSQVKFLKKHEGFHKSKKYKCEVCDKGPFCKSVLRQHLKNHRKDCNCGVCKDCTEIKQLYSCPECKKVLTNPYSLKHHLKIHDGGESMIHECHLCDKKFRHHGSYKKHLKGHETICNCGKCDYCQTRDPRTPKCEICSKMFYTQHHLKRHMVVHTGERSFVCEMCGKGFNQAGNLKVHVRSHLKQKEKANNL